MNTHKPIRTGLVGCGRVAEHGYIPALRQTSGLELIGVADVNRSRCSALAPDLPAYRDIQGLVERESLEAVIISTPSRFHLADARYAAQAGLRSLVEKPPGVDLHEAHLLQELRPQPWIAFNRRFEPAIARLKETLPRAGDINLRLELHYRRKYWNPFDMVDDALLDLGPHLIDLAHWLTDSRSLSARARDLRDRRAEFEIQLERGIAEISCSTDHPYRELIEVKDATASKHSYRRGGWLSGILARLQPRRQNPLVSLLVDELEAFGNAARKNTESSRLATAADGLAVMAVIHAIRRSAADGCKRVSIDPAH